jgi:N-acetylglucosamine kinase
MGYFLGIDGGGTKTASAILDEKGVEIGLGLGGACNIATCDDETLRRSVLDAVASALESSALSAETKFEAVCAGVAGYTAKRRRADFARLLEEIVSARRYRVEPDYVIAYWGATEGEPGIIVSAGTGAVVYGRNEKGETARVDGRGFLLGDKGSSFEIGLFALKITLNSLDAGRDLDPFGRKIMDYIGANDADDVVEWTHRPLDPAKIASIATIVGVLANEGNEVAKLHLRLAASHLRMAVKTISRRIGAPSEDMPVYLLGGLWLLGDFVRRPFETGEDADSHAGRIRFIIRDPRNSPAFGAALLAAKTEAP